MADEVMGNIPEMSSSETDRQGKPMEVKGHPPSLLSMHKVLWHLNRLQMKVHHVYNFTGSKTINSFCKRIATLNYML